MGSDKADGERDNGDGELVTDHLVSIISAGRIWRPWNVLHYPPRHARQLGNVHGDKECLVACELVGQTSWRARVFTGGWSSVSRYSATISSQISL
jgi:hypothetical protein